jgi:hypothetical protein
MCVISIFGGDFLPYIDDLRSMAHYHYTDFHREDAVSLGVDIPTIEHIDALLLFLRETTCPVLIYTKHMMTITEFIEFHKLENITLVEVNTS